MHNYYSEPGFFGGGKCDRSVIVLCYSSMQYEMDIYNITLNYYPNDIWYLRRRYDLNCKSTNVVYRLECILCGLVYVGETKGKLHKRYAVIDPVSLTMLTILFTSILINLITRSFQCEFVLSGYSQHRRIITSRNRKPWLGTLGSLLYT